MIKSLLTEYQYKQLYIYWTQLTIYSNETKDIVCELYQHLLSF